MQIVKRDILSDINPSKTTVILHGCNCFHTMGAGIAKYLVSKFPLILETDKAFAPRGDRNKLGKVCPVLVAPNLYICNCYTQYFYGRKFGIPVSYPAIESCLKWAATAVRPDYDVRSSKIGCSLAGGDWNIVQPLFEKYLPQVTIYTL